MSNYSSVAVTGSSRSLIASYLNADLSKPEILAHVYGVWSYDIQPDLLIEIGGQDSKLILLKKNIISNFRMNSNCAAGTGAFIESQARRYGVSVEEMDEIAQKSDTYVQLNAKCVTFLESALIDLQRRGASKNSLYMAVFNSLCKNYMSSLCQDINIDSYKNIAFIGGVAKISSMKLCFERLLKKEIFVPANCEYMGAVGAVQLLLKKNSTSSEKTGNGNIMIKQCTGCENRCLLNETTLNNGKQIFTGGLCGKYITNV